MRVRPLLLAGLILVLLVTGCTSWKKEAEMEEEHIFLKQFGWTPTATVSRQTVKLPDRFADEPGAYPVGFYWAYNNELSRDVGFDFAPLAGKSVTATIYALKESLADDNPNRAVRAVVIRHDGKIAGAYLDRLGHFGFAASLRGRTFAQVVQKDFGQWLTEAKVVDWNHPFYRQIAAMQPDDVIRAYYGLLNARESSKAWSLHSLQDRAHYLFANRAPGALYNDGFDGQYGGPLNIQGAIVKRIGDFHDFTGEMQPTPEINRKVIQALQYSVSLDLKLVKEITSRNGPQHLFVGVVRETPEAPWLLDSWGTGP